MPKSKVRKKATYSSTPTDRRTPVKARMAGPSHPIYISVMLGMMIIGLAWLVVTYIAADQISFMSGLGAWNFAIGFALMIGGLLMTMRWR
jgi:predicted phage tail protein